jgi:hypothetical protein
MNHLFTREKLPGLVKSNLDYCLRGKAPAWALEAARK